MQTIPSFEVGDNHRDNWFVCRLYIPTETGKGDIATQWLLGKGADILLTYSEDSNLVIIFHTDDHRIVAAINKKYEAALIDPGILYELLKEKYHSGSEAYEDEAYEDEAYEDEAYEDEAYEDNYSEWIKYSNSVIEASNSGWILDDPDFVEYELEIKRICRDEL